MGWVGECEGEHGWVWGECEGGCPRQKVSVGVGGGWESVGVGVGDRK